MTHICLLLRKASTIVTFTIIFFTVGGCDSDPAELGKQSSDAGSDATASDVETDDAASDVETDANASDVETDTTPDTASNSLGQGVEPVEWDDPPSVYHVAPNCRAINRPLDEYVWNAVAGDGLENAFAVGDAGMVLSRFGEDFQIKRFRLPYDDLNGWDFVSASGRSTDHFAALALGESYRAAKLLLVENGSAQTADAPFEGAGNYTIGWPKGVFKSPSNSEVFLFGGMGRIARLQGEEWILERGPAELDFYGDTTAFPVTALAEDRDGRLFAVAQEGAYSELLVREDGKWTSVQSFERLDIYNLKIAADGTFYMTANIIPNTPYGLFLVHMVFSWDGDTAEVLLQSSVRLDGLAVDEDEVVSVVDISGRVAIQNKEGGFDVIGAAPWVQKYPSNHSLVAFGPGELFGAYSSGQILERAGGVLSWPNGMDGGEVQSVWQDEEGKTFWLRERGVEMTKGTDLIGQEPLPFNGKLTLFNIGGFDAEDLYVTGGMVDEGAGAIALFHRNESGWHRTKLYQPSKVLDAARTGERSLVLLTSPTGAGADIRLEKLTEDGGEVLHPAGLDFVPHSLWRAPTGELFVGGAKGRLAFGTEGSFESLDCGVDYSLDRIWGRSATDVYGYRYKTSFEGSGIVHFDGHSCTQIMTKKDGTQIRGVWADGPEYVVAITDKGGSGIALRYGNSWSTMPIQAPLHINRKLYAVIGFGRNDLYFVGDDLEKKSTLLLHFDGSSWSEQHLARRFEPRLAGSGANDLSILGEHGEIAHFDGVGWQETQLKLMTNDSVAHFSYADGHYSAVTAEGSLFDADETFTWNTRRLGWQCDTPVSMWPDEMSFNMVILCNNGAILRGREHTWSEDLSLPPGSYRSVHGNQSGEMFVADGKGVFRRDEKGWIDLGGPESSLDLAGVFSHEPGKIFAWGGNSMWLHDGKEWTLVGTSDAIFFNVFADLKGGLHALALDNPNPAQIYSYDGTWKKDKQLDKRTWAAAFTMEGDLLIGDTAGRIVAEHCY